MLGLLGQYAHNESQAGGRRDEVSELRFEESLTLETKGHLVHPNLIEFPKLEGTFGVTQSDFEVNGEESRADSEIYEFDARARERSPTSTSPFSENETTEGVFVLPS